MGWFGSLGLAYKYALVFGILMILVIAAAVAKIFYNRHRLKKFAKQAELEAQGVQDERVELNARELDEGDLFGIRAIQSGYYGGVAQSRPVSPVGSHSPEGSASNTLLGSRPSPKLMATTPMSSVTALPLDARQSSPLGHDAAALREGSRSAASPRRNLTPINPRLQPSEAERNGRINHDPAVNMSLELPPSPLRPTAAHASPGTRSPSPSYPFPMTNDDHHPTPSALRPGRAQEMKGYTQTLSHSDIHGTEIRSQSGSIVSRSTVDESRHDRARTPNQEYRSPYEEYPVGSLRSAQMDRPVSDDLYYPSQPSNVPRSAPPIATRQPLPHEAPGSPDPRVGPAVSDWGNEIFQEINQSLGEPQSSSRRAIPTPPGPQADHRGTRPPEHFPHPGDSFHSRYTHHASSLSDSSSIYSSTNPAQRHLSRPLSPDFQSTGTTSITPNSSLPSSAESESDNPTQPSTFRIEGTRRGSDSSSHHPAVSSDTTGSGSHRNTRELGDFYDSYWRQSTQGPSMTGRGSDTGRLSQSAYLAARGVGESGKDNKRPGHIDFKVTTIEEVETPLASPMPGTPMPGTAM